jgi:hypothetical protein
MKPGNSGVEKPELSGLFGVFGLFPEVSGFILLTLNHKVVHLFHGSPLTSISFYLSR